MTINTTSIPARGLHFTADLGGPESGELVILLHGFPQTRYTWRAELPALVAQGYRCCAYNQRGYSADARPSGLAAYRVEEMVADTVAVAAALGYQRFHLVGHDWGGQIAWCTAALNPEVVNTLTVISRPHPGAFLQAMANDPAQAARSGHHQKFRSMDAADELLADNAASLRRMYTDWGGVPKADAEAYLATLGERAALDAAINWYRAVPDTTIDFSALPAISAPTLYVWGDADSTVGRIAAEGTGAMLAGPFEFAELPAVGHFVTDEAPGVFTELLLSHLQANA